jgi:Zn-dependent protease
MNTTAHSVHDIVPPADDIERTADAEPWLLRVYTLGQIGGTAVRVHPSVALLVLLLVAQQGRLIDRGVAGYVFAVILVVLLFACVLLHEFGHAFMAQHYKIRVKDITLWPIGGVARVEQMPAKPSAETLVALAGPAVNVAVAVALLPPIVLFSVAFGYDGMDDVLPAAVNSVSPFSLLVWLLLMNVALVAFNLLPLFPMDGGRVLRAGLAAISNREIGTRLAAAIATGVAGFLIIAAVWQGAWTLALVAVFIVVAAQREWRTVRLETAMRRLRVGQFALWDGGGLSPQHPITFALRGGPRDWVVTERGEVVGMLWRHQLLHELNGGAGNRIVADLMDTDVVTADIDASVYAVQQWMHKHNRWAIPITEQGQYRGIFTADRFVHVYRYLQASAARRDGIVGKIDELRRRHHRRRRRW